LAAKSDSEIICCVYQVGRKSINQSVSLCRTRQNVALPEPGKYATGILFVDKDAQNAVAVKKTFQQLAQQAQLQVRNYFSPVIVLLACRSLS